MTDRPSAAAPVDASPFRESPAVAGLRFALELAAWIFIYFAWYSWIALAIAILALTVFGVPGDKHVVLVRVPGPVRVLLEVAVTITGIVAAFDLFGPLGGVAMLAAFVLLVGLSYRRWVWIWRR